jgi:hypothetical protein
MTSIRPEDLQIWRDEGHFKERTVDTAFCVNHVGRLLTRGMPANKPMNKPQI